MGSDAWPELSENLIHDFIDELGEETSQEAKKIQIKESDFPKGKMSEMWSWARNGMGLTILNDADHASYWLYGRGLISKYGTNEVLHWVDPRTGADVFSKHSGPTEPHAEFIPTLEHWIGTHGPEILQEIIDMEGL